LSLLSPLCRHKLVIYHPSHSSPYVSISSLLSDESSLLVAMESSSTSMSSSRGPADATVQVALRIRPQGTREKLEGSKICTLATPGEPQITIGNDRSFTYDHVFDTPTIQREVYDKCIDRLSKGLWMGTMLPYSHMGRPDRVRLTRWAQPSIQDQLMRRI
ncbi:hypothetical protein PENTCL1PPCAC_17742, partial [Pristionchus entomophagus]